MHVLFLSDNFPPETNAPATRLFEHAREWVRAGHRVTVITSAPNFPEGRLHAGWRNSWRARERMAGIDVVRVKTFIYANEGFVLRTLDYLSFAVMALFAGLTVRRPDVVVATSPQFFAALSGWALSALRRRPFVFELRDLWPDSIRAVGALRAGSPAFRLLERLERFLYHRAAAVVSVTESFREDLVRRGIPREKLALVRNGVDLSVYWPRAKDTELLARLGLEDRFIVGYLGTHGMAHALENVLEAAHRLRDREGVHFVFVGSGATRRDLLARARELELPNVSFHPPVKRVDMPRLWSLLDLALVHLKDDPCFATVIPSKLFEAMGVGVPILFAGPDGEAASIVRAAGAGRVVPPEDPDALASAVHRLASRPAERRSLARSSAAAAYAFRREQQAAHMLAVLEAVTLGLALPPTPEPVPQAESDRATARDVA